MAGASLLVLIDDIALLLDDVASMTKIAAKKTAGVLGDDLAVNAEQVSGVNADRELPVVWAVAKGSFRNKLILVPAALAISAVSTTLVTLLMIAGGIYLCFEGFEKITHDSIETPEEKEAHHRDLVQHLADPEVDPLEFEAKKIKGAIRTDFILSAEIIVITMGTVTEQTFEMQLAVVSTIALLMTVGVYGFVAAIVKLDDLGLHMAGRTGIGFSYDLARWFGNRLLDFAPWLMKALVVIGTAAMFLVGGGILLHGFHFLETIQNAAVAAVQTWYIVGPLFAAITPTLFSFIIGILAGGVALGGVRIWNDVLS